MTLPHTFSLFNYDYNKTLFINHFIIKNGQNKRKCQQNPACPFGPEPFWPITQPGHLATCHLHENIKVPSLVRTDESGDEGNMFDRGLFCLCTGSVLIVGGTSAGSIFQGETLSGREMEEVSSQRTFNSIQNILASLILIIKIQFV